MPETNKKAPAAPDAAGGMAREPAGSVAARAEHAQRREKAATDALRALIRDRYLHEFGVRRVAGGPEGLTIRLDLRVRPDAEWAVSFDPPFERQIAPQLDDAQALLDAIRKGRVYCFRCESPACEHAAPPAAGQVFHGYSSTGVPEWCDLVQPLIERKDERVDQLYADPPRPLALVQTGRELKARQLSSFGRASHTYSILGQVLAGYYLLPGRRRSPDSREGLFAVTLQAVEARSGGARPQVRLNAIPAGISVEEWENLLASDWQPALSRAVEAATRALENLERQALAARAGANAAEEIRRIMGQVPGVLHDLARTLDRGARQGERRTRHVEERRGERPVSSATDDARDVRRENLFYDEKRETYVVRGPQHRAHAFTADGRHVTSFVLSPGGAEFRVRTGRWRPAEEAEVAAFHAARQARAAGA